MVEGQNRHPSNKEVGLSLLCNEMSDHTPFFGANIFVQSGATLNINQGSASNPAGNEFSHFFADYQNAGPDVLNYYYYINDPKQDPNASSSGIKKIAVQISPTCTPDFPGGSSEDLADLDSKYSDLQTAYVAALSNYNALIDGGNTAGLLSTVQAATALDAAQVKSTLLGLSPYLSETVLSAGFDRADIFSAGSRYDLLLANPDVMKSGDFMERVYASDHPLSATQLQALEQARYSATARTDAYAALGDLHRQKSAVVRQAIHIIQADSVLRYATLRTWLGRNNGFESNLLIADSYLAEQNLSAWQQQVTAMNSSGLTAQQATDLSNYIAFQQIMLVAASAGRYDDDLNSAELTQLETIALANNRYVSRRVKNLLEWFYGYSFEAGESERPGTPEATAATEQEFSRAETAPFRVYPNPVDQQLTFEWTGEGTPTPYTLRVFDTFGQQLLLRSVTGSQLRLSVKAEGLLSGLYYYSLNNGSSAGQVGKFIVR